MPWWVWVLIAAAVVAVLAAIVWQALARRRTGRLQKHFGPEYDRTLGGADSRRDAEAELQAREERRRTSRFSHSRRPPTSATQEGGRPCRRSLSTSRARPSLARTH